MNAIEVYREVSAMTSQGFVESKEVIRTALNRALAEIGCLYPRKQFVTLRKMRRASVFRLSTPREVGKDSPLTVSALACKEFVLRGFGKGEAILTLGGRQLEKVVLDGNPFSYEKTLSSLGSEGEFMILFRSEDGMVLEELVLYGGTWEDAHESRGGYTLYRMEDEMPTFLSFGDEIYKNHRLLDSGTSEVLLEGDCVKIADDAAGLYEIACYVAPVAVTKENEGDAITLLPEVLCLVPLLTAYYACLEAEDARADDFLVRYREASGHLRNRMRVALHDTVEDVRGW